MTAADMQALLPLIGLGASAVVLVAAIAIRRSHVATLALALIGLSASFALLFPAAAAAPRQATALIAVDGHTLFYQGLLMAAAMAVILLVPAYLEGRSGPCEEFYVLLLLATCGACVLAGSTHFASLFLGLELLTVPLYGLIAYVRTGRRSLEAGVKYLILAGASSAFLLFGMALVYAAAGTMEFSGLAAAQGGGPGAAGLGAPGAAAAGAVSGPFGLAGLGLIAVGVGFKLAVVPFHMWTPDVYEGAPAPVTAFVATVSKGAVAAVLVRYAAEALGGDEGRTFLALFGAVAVASMLAGSVLALLQQSIKRLLAYSSIAHLGYVLVAFLAAGERGRAAVAFYLGAYFCATLLAFGAITALSGKEEDFDALGGYRGLGRRHPCRAAVLASALFSLAGIPLTAGFVGKLLVLSAGVDAGLWLLVAAFIASSAVGVYYYLRVAVLMFMTQGGDGEPVAPAAAAVPLAGAATLAGLTLALFWLGIQPGLFLELIQGMLSSPY